MAPALVVKKNKRRQNKNVKREEAFSASHHSMVAVETEDGVGGFQAQSQAEPPCRTEGLEQNASEA